ncbi:MAG TPA: tetratricopeptide repeat protein [Gemmatimonadales bacterium]|nr:tetratricopeptide repeat protein [Gemmatimonadales bacterium]
MSEKRRAPPLRVEQALSLLPEVDALAPLRAFLVSTSRARTAAEPHRTVGKRLVEPGHLREAVPLAVNRITDHLAGLFASAVEALECEQRGERTGAVYALLAAGDREERVGRYAQAFTWYDHALRVAAELHERRAEIDTLLRLGHLERIRQRFDDAARFYQRALALAEGEMDGRAAAVACRGLGESAMGLSRWQGAESWFMRGLQYAGEEGLAGRLQLGLGEVARSRGRLDQAETRLREARATLEAQQDVGGLVRSLNAWGQFEAARGRHAEALEAYREALARLPGVGRHPRLEMAIRVNICELYLDWGRLREAEDEIRRAEESAILNNLSRFLARLYLLLGQVRARQRDDTGFVFFEKTIELCRGPEPLPRLEAEAYLEYALFRRDLHDTEEARAYLERAREILETVGDGNTLARIDAALAQVERV